MTGIHNIALRSRSGTTFEVLAYLPNEASTSHFRESLQKQNIQIIDNNERRTDSHPSLLP